MRMILRLTSDRTRLSCITSGRIVRHGSTGMYLRRVDKLCLCDKNTLLTAVSHCLYVVLHIWLSQLTYLGKVAV